MQFCLLSDLRSCSRLKDFIMVLTSNDAATKIQRVYVKRTEFQKMDHDTFKKRLVAFYKYYEPSKAHNSRVETIIIAYGNRRALIHALRIKYGDVAVRVLEGRIGVGGEDEAAAATRIQSRHRQRGATMALSERKRAHAETSAAATRIQSRHRQRGAMMVLSERKRAHAAMDTAAVCIQSWHRRKTMAKRGEEQRFRKIRPVAIGSSICDMHSTEGVCHKHVHVACFDVKGGMIILIAHFLRASVRRVVTMEQVDAELAHYIEYELPEKQMHTQSITNEPCIYLCLMEGKSKIHDPLALSKIATKN